MNSYVFDTSAIIDAGERYYPIDVFPSFWKKMEDLVHSGRFIAPEFLIDELSKKDDEWRDWVHQRRDKIIIATDQNMLAAVSEIMSNFPALVDVNKNRSGGDPFFIALAKITDSVLVTGEKSGTASKPKIPDVCGGMNIPCINVLKLIRNENWQF